MASDHNRGNVAPEKEYVCLRGELTEQPVFRSEVEPGVGRARAQDTQDWCHVTLPTMKSRHSQAGSVKLIAFPGNPGSRYENTRHNVGRMVAALIDDAASPAGIVLKGGTLTVTPWKDKFHGRFRRIGEMVLLVPDAYMNESGRSVQAALSFFGISRSEMLVVHDDLETPFGTVETVFGGGHRGNNGVRSIAQACGGPDFWRLRIGIGRPPANRKPGDWVLERFSRDEEARLPEVLDLAYALITTSLTDQIVTKKKSML